MKTQIFNLFFPVRPVPASRPRVSQRGTYYTGHYVEFRKELGDYLNTIKDQYPPTAHRYAVHIEFLCKKPQKPIHSYPRGDIDNFLKAPLDSITKAGMFWIDDVQVVTIEYAHKRYADTDEQVGILVRITRYEDEEPQ